MRRVCLEVNENETDFKEKMREINESKEAHIYGEKTKGQISRLLQSSKLKRDYRYAITGFQNIRNLRKWNSPLTVSTKSREEQAALAYYSPYESLVTEFEANIVAAKESREAKIEQHKEARRQAEAATAAADLKRKEEERRKNQERLQAESGTHPWRKSRKSGIL